MTISRLSMTGISPESFVTSENETAKVCRDHDIWRRKNFYFGFDFVGLGPEACFAQLDERSALFAVDFALSHPMGKALAIPSPAFRASLNAEIARTSLDNLAIYSERGALLRDLKAQRGGCVDGLLYGLCSSTNGLLAEVDGLKIGAIAGEFSDDEVDPLEVYRMSQRIADSFCWRGASNGRVVSGRRSVNPEVSVVVPIYNVENYLDQCVSSISAQTLRSREILLVDDGSTDGSAAIAARWAERDLSIRVITKENGGCASARMRGLQEAKGQFVAFVDSDDWIDPEMLESLFRLAVLNRTKIAQCGWRECFVDGSNSDQGADELKTAWIDEFGDLFANNDLAVLGKPTIWRRIYDTEFLRGNRIEFPIQFRRFDDLPFQFRALSLGERISVSPQSFYNYRLGRDGQDVAINDERLYIHFPILAYMRRLVHEVGNKIMFRNFLRIQLATHVWGRGKIRRELRANYTRNMIIDLFGEEQGLSSYSLLRRFTRIAPAEQWRLFRWWLLYVFSRKGESPEVPGLADRKIEPV